MIIYPQQLELIILWVHAAAWKVKGENIQFTIRSEEAPGSPCRVRGQHRKPSLHLPCSGTPSGKPSGVGAVAGWMWRHPLRFPAVGLDGDCGSLLSSGQFTPEIPAGVKRRPVGGLDRSQTDICFVFPAGLHVCNNIIYCFHSSSSSVCHRFRINLSCYKAVICEICEQWWEQDFFVQMETAEEQLKDV